LILKKEPSTEKGTTAKERNETKAEKSTVVVAGKIAVSHLILKASISLA